MKKTNLLMVAFLAIGALTLASCGDDDNTKGGGTETETVVTDGVYVLNEGSMYNKVPGTLNFYDNGSATSTANFFQKANGKALGDTPNDAVINDEGEMYIAVSGENKVWVADARTMKVKAEVNITYPREIACDESNVYVSSWDGKVYKIDDKSHKVVSTSEKVGDCLEGLVVTGGHVYVCNACNADYTTYYTNVVKLTTGLTKEKDITVAANPNQIVTDGQNMFVASWGNYMDVNATVQQIDLHTDQVTPIAEASKVALYANRVYLVNAPYGKPATYSLYDLNSKKTTEWIKGTEIVSPYAMTVDPSNGDVYISSYGKDPATGYASYTLNGYMARYKADGKFAGQFECGLNPGTILFLNHTEKNAF